MNSLKLGSSSGLETLEGSLLKYRRIARKKYNKIGYIFEDQAKQWY